MNAPPRLSTLGRKVLSRIVRELADPERLDFNKSIFPDDVYDLHNRNYSMSYYQFHKVINELIEKSYLLYEDTLDGMIITLNPACSALEEVRQKVYKAHEFY